MKTSVRLSIVLFLLVAVAHLTRLVAGWPVTVDDWAVPAWVSIAGVVVPAALAAMLWRDAH